jgi:C_GCAxxG_C_C family probable redox protein
MKVAAGFGGGMGRMAGTCGAVTGAYMVIGLKYGNTLADDRDAKERTHAKVQDFARRFCERHHWLECKKLLGCDISTAEGMELARDKKLFVSICPQLVAHAAEVLESVLEGR